MDPKKIETDIGDLQARVKLELGARGVLVDSFHMELRTWEKYTGLVTLRASLTVPGQTITYNLPVHYPFTLDTYKWISAGFYDSVSK